MVPFHLAVLIYVACGGLIWLIVHFLAPVGTEISLSRGILAVFLFTAVNAGMNGFLRPILGDWTLLVGFVTQVAIVAGVFHLTFLRSVSALALYYLTVGAAYYFLVVHPRRAAQLWPMEFAC